MNTRARKANSAKGAIDLVFPSAPKLLVIAVALACSSSGAFAANKTWSEGGGDWSDNNWGGSWVWGSGWVYNSKPADGDSVTIDPSGGSKTVTYAGTGYTNNSLTINSLTFSNGSTADILDLTGGTLTVTNKFWAKTNSIVKVNTGATLTLNGTGSNASSLSNLSILGGTLNGSGTVGISALTFSSGTLDGSGAVTVSGATTWSGGTMTGSGSTAANGGLTVSNSTVLARTLTGSTLTNNGTLDIQADKNLTFTGAISNAGTLTKTTTSGTTVISGGSAVNNSGSILATTGTLTFAQGVSGAGSATVSNGATLNLDGTSALKSLTLTGTLGGSGVLTVSGSGGGTTWNGGTMTGSGSTAANNGLTVSGPVVLQRTLNGSTLTVNSGSTLDIQADKNLTFTSGSNNFITNNGTLQKTAGTGTSTVTTDASSITNNGTIIAGSGTLRFSKSIFGTSGTLQTTGGTLDLRDNSTASLVIIGAGSLLLNGKTLTVTTDYFNSNFGTGNSFDRNASVTLGTGGAIKAAGASQTTYQKLSVDGGLTKTALNDATLAFGNMHVGASSAKDYVIYDTASTVALRGAIQGTGIDSRLTGSGVNVNSSSWMAAAGGNTTRTVVLTGSSAGAVSSSVNIVNNFSNTNSQTLAITGKVYQYAQPTFTGSSPVNFGIVHVGDTASQAVGITNTSAAPADYQEKLNASISTASAGINTAGGPVSIAQGASSTALSVGIDTATAGLRSGTATVALVSDGAGTSGLGTSSLPSQNVSVLGQVNNYAAVGLTQTGGAGNFSGSGTNYVFDLGTITFGTGSASGSLSLANTGGNAAFTDYLSGAFNLAGVTNFTLTGFNSFSGLQGGSSLGLGVTLNNNALGSFDQYVTLTPTGYNAGGYSGGLSPITLELKGNVVAAVPEPASYAMFIAGLGLMAGIARRRRQQG